MESVSLMDTDNPVRYFDNIWTRKPSEWDDCTAKAVATMPAKVRNWILTLPKHRFARTTKPIHDFPEFAIDGNNFPRYFIAEVGDSQFIVSTEGYNYARYGVKIKAV